MPELSNYAICYEAIQRIYRNVIIREARRLLKQAYGDDWLKNVEAVFQKEWNDVVQAANEIRVTGFVGASLVDDFDCLGVNHFHNLFAKFFNELFPRSAKVSDIVREEERKAVLRFAKEVNDYRNAMSHPSETDLPRRDAVRLLDSACRLLSKIDPQAADMILEYEGRLQGAGVTAGEPDPERTLHTPRTRSSKDTMIQDVNALNARFFFDNYAYVGGGKMMAAPKYFAPYFTKECVRSPLVPEITEDGISRFSDVLHVIEIPLRKLRTLDAREIDRLVPDGQQKNRWKLGVELIIARERKEGFSESNDPHRLYLLGAPQWVTHGVTIRKDGYLPTIPHGFGTAFGLLKTATTLRALKV